MSLSVGIIGLPNVGKSTLFNALLKKQVAYVANYPFATIEPNVGVVPVPDERLEVLADIVAKGSFTSGESWLSLSLQSATPEVMKRRPPIISAVVQFVDIAGLVKGAAEGEGLGNKFLSHIREVSIVCHVIRAFMDENVTKEGSVDVRTDYQTIQTELILADLQSISNSRLKVKSLKLQSKVQGEILDKIEKGLNQGIPARDIDLTEEEKEVVGRQLFLLSAKPEIIILNVSEGDYNPDSVKKIIEQYENLLGVSGERLVVICAKIEAELADLSESEQKEYLGNLGLKESGLERLIKKAYETLGLISFLTAPSSAKASEGQGEKYEVRAWTIRVGSTAQTAAGTIHTDFRQKFIKAEVVSFDDFISLGGWKKARELGKARFEGRDYLVQDGDVIEFKIGS